MRRLTADNTVNAVTRNYQRRCRVRLLSFAGARGTFLVTCDSGHGHTVEIERRRDGGLYGDCYFAETGEVCPSELGGRVCYHRTGAAALFRVLERGGAGRAVRRVRRYSLGDCVLIGSAVAQSLPRFGRHQLDRHLALAGAT